MKTNKRLSPVPLLVAALVAGAFSTPPLAADPHSKPQQTAAVAKQAALQKIKKKDEVLNLALTRTDDIAATLGKRKQNGQVIVGFALETEEEEGNALKKLQSKNFDLIVLNSLNDAGAGFGHDTNKITIMDGKKKSTFDLKSKKNVAADIVQAIIEKIHA